MDNDEQMLRKRFVELEERARVRSVYYFTDFLSMADASLLADTLLPAEYKLFGGAEGCERVMARFGNPDELGYEEEFPITIIMIEPLLPKFADDLTHRDFLGALVNLGIDRGVIGDIIVRDKTAYVFAVSRIAGYITDRLDRVRHTNVKCSCISPDMLPDQAKPALRPERLTVASERIDAVISGLYNMPRNKSADMFRRKNVFVNGRLSENNSAVLKPGDVVAVRGYGKFIYKGILYRTKKEKICAEVQRYV